MTSSRRICCRVRLAPVLAFLSLVPSAALAHSSVTLVVQKNANLPTAPSLSQPIIRTLPAGGTITLPSAHTQSSAGALPTRAIHVRGLPSPDSLCAAPASQPGLHTATYDVGSARTLTREGRWFIDDKRRYVLFRGVNFGPRSKLPPYLSVAPLTAASDSTPPSTATVRSWLDSLAPQFCQLHLLGIDVARVLVIWKALEPTAADADTLSTDALRYLADLRLIVDELHRHGIFVVLDFHQDVASERFGGDGFPDWAIVRNGNADTTKVVAPDPSWGLRYYDSRLPKWLIFPHNESVRLTLRAFWNDSLPIHSSGKTAPLTNQPSVGFLRVRSHLEHMIGRTAAFFSDDPAVLGIEPLNEPHPVGIPKKYFEESMLAAFFHNVADTLQQADRAAFLFLEPRMDWTTFTATDPEPAFRVRDVFRLLHWTHDPVTYLPDASKLGPRDRAVFAFHFYDPWLAVLASTVSMTSKQREWMHTFDVMSRTADRLDMVPFLTEFGCTQDWRSLQSDLRPRFYVNVTRACIDLQYQMIERYMLNATYWNYELYTTPRGFDNWNFEDLSLLDDRRRVRDVDIVARPYPMRSAAKPKCLFFDAESKNAAMTLHGRPTRAPTIVFVPMAVQYGDSVEIHSNAPASSLTWDDDQQLLSWSADSSATEHWLTLSRPGKFDGALIQPHCTIPGVTEGYRSIILKRQTQVRSRNPS